MSGAEGKLRPRKTKSLVGSSLSRNCSSSGVEESVNHQIYLVCNQESHQHVCLSFPQAGQSLNLQATRVAAVRSGTPSLLLRWMLPAVGARSRPHRDHCAEPPLVRLHDVGQGGRRTIGRSPSIITYLLTARSMSSTRKAGTSAG
jgi:hypothetical protein